jgi:cell division protein FtsZ
VANSAAPEANIIFGAVIDDALGDEVRVTVIAAGFDEPEVNGGVAREHRPVDPPEAAAPTRGISSGRGEASAPAAPTTAGANGASATSMPWIAPSRPAEPAPAQETRPAAPQVSRPAEPEPTHQAPPAPAEPEPAPAESAAPAPPAQPYGAADGQPTESFAYGGPAPEPAQPEARRNEPQEDQEERQDGQAGSIHAVSDASAERRGEVTTPRRRVIFDDPDDLDVPEFLK